MTCPNGHARQPAPYQHDFRDLPSARWRPDCRLRRTAAALETWSVPSNIFGIDSPVAARLEEVKRLKRTYQFNDQWGDFDFFVMSPAEFWRVKAGSPFATLRLRLESRPCGVSVHVRFNHFCVSSIPRCPGSLHVHSLLPCI